VTDLATGAATLAVSRIRGKAGGENFRVASRLLPARTRSDLLAVYGVARLIDDAGDDAAGDRGAILDELEADVGRMYAGAPRHPLFVEMQPVVRDHAIPPSPFLDLIEANRIDQRRARYDTFGDLLSYCALSANPVGRLVLSVFDALDERTRPLADDVCTGLQLAEHWRDVREDLERGRVYLPSEDLSAFRVRHADLAALRASEALRRLMRFEAGRAHLLLDAGRALASILGGRAGWAVRAYVAGGRAALRRLERVGYDPLAPSRVPSHVERAVELLLEPGRGGPRP
jgi:squalene synthase HpnC